MPQLKADITTVATEAMRDQGIGVLRLKRDGNGHWQRAGGSSDRRIDGLAGLDDPAQRLRSSGPASSVFRLSERQGYDDGLGDRIIGTLPTAPVAPPPGARCSALKRTSKARCQKRSTPMAAPWPQQRCHSAAQSSASTAWAIPLA